MHLHQKILISVGLALFLSGTSLFAEGKSPDTLIHNAYRYIGTMDTYAFTAHVSEDAVEDGGMIKKYQQNVTAKVSRPDKLRVDTKGDIKDRSTYLSDGVYTIIDHDAQYYAQLSTPKSIDAALDYIFTKFGIVIPMSSLYYSDMDKRVRFTASKYFGVVSVDGVACDYVAFKNADKEVHAWITTGDKPLLKALSIIDRDMQGNPKTNMVFQWETPAHLSPNDFIFKASENVSKITVDSTH